MTSHRACARVPSQAEIRVNYESGNSNYWQAMGVVPVEAAWRLKQI